MDFGSLLAEVGDFGAYQIILFFLICLPANIPSAFSAFNQPFVVGLPEHQCRLPNSRPELAPIKELATEEQLHCKQYNSSYILELLNLTESDRREAFKHIPLIPCQSGWIYDNSTYIETLATEFDLVCTRRSWIDITSMAFYVGSFIGNIVFGQVADKFGRRTAFFIILASQVIFGTLNAFAWDVVSFAVFRFLTGLPFPALYQVPFIIVMEFMGESGRIFAGILIDVFFGAAMVLLGVVAMYVRRWRYLVFYSNAPFVLFFLYYFILPESPRWLVSVGKYDEAKKVLKRIAKVNKRTEVDIDALMLRVQSQTESDPHGMNKYNCTDLFKTPNLRKKTLLVTYIWFVNALVYNGLTYNISNLPVSDHISFIINGAVELPAYLLVWPLLDTVGRRWALVSPMFLAGFACVSTIFVPAPADNPWFVSAMAYVGKFGIAASFAVIYVFASELYPTVVRGVGMGMSSMVAGSGLILGPHLIRLGDINRVLPLLIMGLLSVSAAIASFFLPETLGLPVPQTIEEAEEVGKTENYTCLPSKSFRSTILFSVTDMLWYL